MSAHAAITASPLIISKYNNIRQIYKLVKFLEDTFQYIRLLPYVNIMQLTQGIPISSLNKLIERLQQTSTSSTLQPRILESSTSLFFEIVFLALVK